MQWEQKETLKRESYSWHVRMCVMKQTAWSLYSKTGPCIVVSLQNSHVEKDITKEKYRDYDSVVFSKVCTQYI